MYLRIVLEKATQCYDITVGSPITPTTNIHNKIITSKIYSQTTQITHSKKLNSSKIG